MAWDLNGADQYARFAMSAALKAAVGGPFTFGAVVNLDSATDGALIHCLDGTTGRHFMEVFTSFNFGTAAAAKSGPAAADYIGSWVHVIMTKDTGSVVPEYTVIPLAGGAAVSGSCAGGNLANGAAPGAAGQTQVGRWGTSATEYVDGKIAALWMHASYLNQAAREALTTWALTVTAAQVSNLGWAVRLDTLSSITDATGQGGDETGRFGTTPFTLAADPSGAFFGSSTVTGAAAASLGALSGAAAGAPSAATVTGTAAADLGGLTGATAGASVIVGAGAATLGALSGAASGKGTITGLGAATLGGLSAAAVTAGTTTGSAAAVLAALGAAAVGRRTVLGAGAAVLGGLTAAAAPGPTGMRGVIGGRTALAVGAVTVHTVSIVGSING